MEPEIAGDPPASKDRSGNAFDRMPELPSVRKRWTVRRKAAVIEQCAEAGCRSIKSAEFTRSLSKSFWRGNATWIGMACQGSGSPVIRSTVRLRRGRPAKMAPRTLTEQLALSMLARGGIAAIWQL